MCHSLTNNFEREQGGRERLPSRAISCKEKTLDWGSKDHDLTPDCLRCAAEMIRLSYGSGKRLLKKTPKPATNREEFKKTKRDQFCRKK